jgi:hypothetical protein
MTKLASILVAFCMPVFAHAYTVEKGIKYQEYKVENSGQQISLKISKRVLTDGCNDYSLGATASSTASDGEESDWPFENVFVVKYGVTQTEMACEPPTRQRYETLKSNLVKVEATEDDGPIIRILVPEDVKVQFFQ